MYERKPTQHVLYTTRRHSIQMRCDSPFFFFFTSSILNVWISVYLHKIHYIFWLFIYKMLSATVLYQRGKERFWLKKRETGMRHGWIEEKMGGNWIQFFFSLKTSSFCSIFQLLFRQCSSWKLVAGRSTGVRFCGKKGFFL